MLGYAIERRHMATGKKLTFRDTADKLRVQLFQSIDGVVIITAVRRALAMRNVALRPRRNNTTYMISVVAPSR